VRRQRNLVEKHERVRKDQEQRHYGEGAPRR